MTKSDELIQQAVRMMVDIEVNDRKVSVSENKALISLFGSPVIEVDYSNESLLLFKDVPVTRKSARVINSILSAYTDYVARRLNGYWVLNSKSGHAVPVSGKDVVISMNASIETVRDSNFPIRVDKIL